METKTERIAKNYRTADVGPLAELDSYRYQNDRIPADLQVRGKLFLGNLLNLTSCEISLNKLAPRTAHPFHHKHKRNEEIYIFLGGEGEFSVDNDLIAVREGTVIRVAQEGVRCWRNTTDEPLYYIVVQAAANLNEVGMEIDDGIGIMRPAIWD